MDIKRMLADLNAERERIEKAIQALDQLNATSAPAVPRRGRPAGKSLPAPAAANSGRGRRRMSAAARKRLSQLAKARWAERRKAKG